MHMYMHPDAQQMHQVTSAAKSIKRMHETMMSRMLSDQGWLVCGNMNVPGCNSSSSAVI